MSKEYIIPGGLIQETGSRVYSVAGGVVQETIAAGSTTSTMVAGDLSAYSPGWTGYDLSLSAGSLSPATMNGLTVAAIITIGSLLAFIVDGDAVTELTGKSLYIDDVEYPFTSVYDNGSGQTEADITTTFTFTISQSYQLKVDEPGLGGGGTYHYLGVSARSTRYLGSRTDAQIYLGTKTGLFAP